MHRRYRFWRWKIHWQILLAIALGIGVGAAFQALDAEPRVGIVLDRNGSVVELGAEAKREGVQLGDRILSVGGEPWTAPDARSALRVPEGSIGAQVGVGLDRAGAAVEVELTREIGPDSPRASALAPFDFLGELFRRLLQMLIVPLVFTSLVTGVLSLGDLGSLGRLGARAVLYYALTSFFAVVVGLVFVNAIAPGRGAQLDLRAELAPEDFASDDSIFGIFLRMVPENPIGALADNGSILQVIFFAILVGISITRTGGEHAELLRRFFDAAYEVMMRLAQAVLVLIPIGVFALIVRVAGASGLSQFAPLLVFMTTVVLALSVHALVVLPALLFFVGRIRPWRWARAVSPALMTAFSTSSSSITLPVTLKSVQDRGRVSNRTSSFVLPLGATINMDGTALYECVAVIFLAQYYASSAGYELSLADQLKVVVTSLLASVGAAGIPSAGLVMMTTILTSMKLPLEGVLLLLAVDRPLDMLRTAVNIWSDTSCTAIVARLEGEKDLEGAR